MNAVPTLGELERAVMEALWSADAAVTGRHGQAALALLVFGVALAEPVSRLLARARWPGRDPVGALLLWQAIGLAGGLALLGAGLIYGLAPLGPPPVAVDAALAELRAGRLPALGVPHVVALVLTAALAARLLGV